jgi:ribosomal protein S18 acetylase RimI-like enzyme
MSLIARLQTYFTTQVATHDTGSDLDVASFVPTSSPLADLSAVVFACTSTTFRSVSSPSAVSFVVLSSQSPLAAICEHLDTNARGFEPAAVPATATEAASFRGGLIANRAITALLNGLPIAAGMFTPPALGIAELVGITTLIPFRKRGIGTALTSELVRVAFMHDVDLAILSTDNPSAAGVYERIGFQPVAVRIARSGQAGIDVG